MALSLPCESCSSVTGVVALKKFQCLQSVSRMLHEMLWTMKWRVYARSCSSGVKLQSPQRQLWRLASLAARRLAPLLRGWWLEPPPSPQLRYFFMRSTLISPTGERSSCSARGGPSISASSLRYWLLP